MISLPPADRKHIYQKRSMYAGTHYTDPDIKPVTRCKTCSLISDYVIENRALLQKIENGRHWRHLQVFTNIAED